MRGYTQKTSCIIESRKNVLATTVQRIWHNRPRLSSIFWFSTISLYLIGLVAISALVHPTLNEIFQNAKAHELVVVKLNYVRLPLIFLIMAVFPVLLWNSLGRTLSFMRLATAAVIFNYIDDHLVLFEIVSYPRVPIFKLALFLRPFAIMAMLWITFELYFRVQLGESQ